MAFKRLPYFDDLCRFRFDDLNAFVKQTEGGTSDELKRFSEWVDSHAHDMTDEQVEEFIDHHYDKLAEVRDIVPRLLRYSHFLVIFGLFENQAAALCRLLHGDGVIARKPRKHLHLLDIQQYLVDQGHFRKRTFGPSWNFLNKARELRNAIAHNGGVLHSDAAGKRARAFIRSVAELSLDGSGAIEIEPGFSHKLLAHSQAALFALLNEADTLY